MTVIDSLRLQRMADRALTRADKVALGLRERTPGDYVKMAKAAAKKQRKQLRALKLKARGG